MKNLVLLSITLIAFSVNAQFSGYYGKKTYVDVAYKFFIPMFGNLRGQNVGFDENLNRKKDWFNYGYRINLSRMTSNHISIGLEFDQDMAQITVPYDVFYKNSTGYDYTYVTIGKHETLNTSTITIMPKIGVSRNSILPLGITHEFGIGYTITSIEDKDYSYMYTFEDYDDEIGNYKMFNINNTTNGALIDYSEKYKGLTFLYALNVKKNITKSLFFNYGFRYTFNWLLGKGNISYNDMASNNILSFSKSDVFDKIRRQRMLNFVTASIGLTYAF